MKLHEWKVTMFLVGQSCVAIGTPPICHLSGVNFTLRLRPIIFPHL